MADGRRHPRAAGPSDPSILTDILDAGYDQVTRAIEAARRNLGNGTGVANLQRYITSIAQGVFTLAALVVAALQQPLGYRVEVRQRPLYMHVVVPVAILLAAQGLINFTSGPTPGSPETAVRHDLNPTTEHQTTRQQEVSGYISQVPYSPHESGVVSETCFLISKISALTARAPGAQTLYDFVNSGVESGAAQSDVLPIHNLCGACLASEASSSAIVGGEGRGVRSAWEAAEAKERRQTLERSIILLSDPSSAAVYQRLFVDGADSETYYETKSRMALLCGQSWR